MISVGRMPCDDGLIRTAPSPAGRADEAAGAPTAGDAEPVPVLGGGRGTGVLAATILGSSMAFIDGSVVNIALPAIQADLASTVAGMQWVVNGYMLMLGALVLVGGAAGDRFGRRRIFTVGIIVFTLASLACAAASSLPLLVAARALQGIGAALLVPSSLSLISASFDPADRGRAIGTWAGMSALTTALGPVLGGWLVDTLSWRIIFLINLPVAAVTLVIAFRHVPESRDDQGSTGIDWLGGVLATLGLAALVYGLSAASEDGWLDPAVLGSLAAGLLILGAFVRAEGRAVAPMMPLALFGSRAFSGANGMTLLLYFALGGVMFLLPFNLIGVQGYSAAAAGASFLPFTVVLGGLSRWSGSLVDRYGARGPLVAGPVVAAAGFALFAVPGTAAFYWTTFFPAMLVVGFGMAISIAPLTATVMAAVDDRHAGTASGINNAAARIAGMLAVAILGALSVAVFGASLEHRLAGLALPPDLLAALMAEVPRLADAQVPAAAQADLRPALQTLLDDAFIASFRFVMLVAAGFALMSAACAALTLRAGAPSP